MTALENLWMETTAEFYPPAEEDEAQAEKTAVQHDKFPEERIDSLIKQKA